MSRNAAATVFVGNLDSRVDERILYNLMQQAGPLVDLYMPRDRDASKPEQEQRHKGYGFAEYADEDSAAYAVQLFSGNVRLFNRQVRFQISTAGKASPAVAGISPAAAAMTDRVSDRAESQQIPVPPRAADSSHASPQVSSPDSPLLPLPAQTAQAASSIPSWTPPEQSQQHHRSSYTQPYRPASQVPDKTAYIPLSSLTGAPGTASVEPHQRYYGYTLPTSSSPSYPQQYVQLTDPLAGYNLPSPSPPAAPSPPYAAPLHPYLGSQVQLRSTVGGVHYYAAT